VESGERGQWRWRFFKKSFGVCLSSVALFSKNIDSVMMDGPQKKKRESVCI
jgi:hypothetical protein